MLLFLFSLSCVKSPSYTLSPSHDPNPHPWLLPKTSSRDTSCLAPSCDLRTEVQRSGRECSHAPTCQPGLMGMPPLTSFFASSGSLPPFFQVISPALDARDSTTKSTPGPGAESHGEWRTVSWYWHHDRWCWLCAFIGSPNHTLTPLSALLERTQKCIPIGVPLSRIRVGRWSNVQRGSYEHSQESHSPNRKAVRPPPQLDCEMVPVFIKQIPSEHQATQGDGRWECSTEQVRRAQPPPPNRDHVFVQTLSSRKTPMQKKI